MRRPDPGFLEQILRMTIGLPFASWRYFCQGVEIRRYESSCPWPIEGFPAPDCVRAGDPATLQRPAGGCGPVFHRIYRAEVRKPLVRAAELMSVIRNDPNVACPVEIARFERTARDCAGLEAGEEMRIRLPGPWNGPVRVVEVTSSSFRLATLVGHMEAGEIEFRAEDTVDGLSIEIESWARSSDRAFDIVYDRLRLARELQLDMWAFFLERMTQVSGGALADGIDVFTQRCDEHPL